MSESLANPDRTTLIGQLSGADYAGYPDVMTALKAAGEAMEAQHKAVWEALPQEKKDALLAEQESRRVALAEVWERIEPILKEAGMRLTTTNYGEDPALTNDSPYDDILNLRTCEFH